MRPTVLLSSSLVTLLLGACSGGESGALVHTAPFPTAPTQSFAGPGSSAADVSGLWNWGARGQFTVPRAVVERLFGIEPEGPVTHLRCETSGSVQLVQSGTTFSGLATRTAGSCESGDGLVFVPPPTAWPNSLPVAEGVIKGRSVHFDFGSVAGLGCPHNGAISGVDAGRATEITANGRCIIPGHPQSPVPLHPPPAGTSHDTSFVATRP